LEQNTVSKKSGYVGIVGKPNVGKSTLLNRLIGVKIAAMSRKPQTTRHRILGILTLDNAQILFLDTPGIISKPKHELHKRMIKNAVESLEEADVVLFITDPFGPDELDMYTIELLKKHEKPVICAINKVDMVEKTRLLPLIETYNRLYPFKEIFPMSVTMNINVDELLDSIVKYLPEGEFYYPEDTTTDRNERFMVEEIIREKLYNLYGEEIPYAAAVKVDEFIEKDERHGGVDYIRAIIYVEKESQKPIIIGKGGLKIKKLGTYARKEIEAFLGRKVFLELWVKVHERWRKDRQFLDRLSV